MKSRQFLYVGTFLLRDRHGMGTDGRRSGEEVGGVKGAKTVIKIDHVRGKLSSTQGKQTKQQTSKQTQTKKLKKTLMVNTT